MSDELERGLARIEASALSAAEVGGFLALADRIRDALRDTPDDVRLLVLTLSAPRIERSALAAVLDAFALGRDDAARILASAAPDGTARLRPPRDVAAGVRGLDREGERAITTAQRLAVAGAAGGIAAEAIAAPVLGHARAVRAGISDAVNRAGNAGEVAVAKAAGVNIVWVAETNACVHCLAYSGRVVAAGERFPGGLTYAAVSYHKAPIVSPPRHPNCRCTLEPLVAREYADALRREADRSVLRGFSLESESMAVRVSAAERLLKSGVDAPKSVVQFSRRAVREGRFPTRGRPSG